MKPRMGSGGHPFWPFWEKIRSWREIRTLPNVLLVHYADLKNDMPAGMREIAAFLDIPIDEARWPSIMEYCSFGWMKIPASLASTCVIRVRYGVEIKG